MSRLASKPIVIDVNTISIEVKESTIEIKNKKNNKVEVFNFNNTYVVPKFDGQNMTFERNEANKTPVGLRGLLGTTWALFKVAVKNITEGYKSKLNFVGVGYKAAIVKGGAFTYLRIIVGFSHPIFIFVPKEITLTQEKDTIIVSGNNVLSVTQFCAKVRSQKKPTVYHGTGVIVNDEKIIKKVGKKK